MSSATVAASAPRKDPPTASVVPSALDTVTLSLSRSAIVNDPVSVKLLVPSPDPPSVISVTAPATSV